MYILRGVDSQSYRRTCKELKEINDLCISILNLGLRSTIWTMKDGLWAKGITWNLNWPMRRATPSVFQSLLAMAFTGPLSNPASSGQDINPQLFGVLYAWFYTASVYIKYRKDLQLPYVPIVAIVMLALNGEGDHSA